jgi:hypothetical protein
LNEDHTRTWECPECGQLFVTPDTIYQAICSCPSFTAFPTAVTGTAGMMRAVNMVDITNRPGRPDEWTIRAVPDLL